MEPSAGNLSTNDFSRLLSESRGGSTEALGELLKRYEDDLVSHADVSVRYQTKFDASDLVQETFLKALRHFADFRGTTFLEWQAWLRAILNRILVSALRHYCRARRNIGHELSLDQAPFALKQLLSARQFLDPLVAVEDEAILCHICDSQPTKYRDIIRLRLKQRLSFVEIGIRLSCSAEAARKR
jgi:RNA polymerase sigma-70 factor (subfamily 1)